VNGHYVRDKDSDAEEALSQWFSSVTACGVQVSGPVLKIKSDVLAKMWVIKILKQWMLIVSIEIQFWDKIREGTPREGLRLCCKC
jgi:hypothetical protein